MPTVNMLGNEKLTLLHDLKVAKKLVFSSYGNCRFFSDNILY
ncbi:hypothetical protein bcere0027_40040 [Bacillus cereus AH676]|uniref:Uncharacterized protein n=1 Tax=Bacillus cereus (strain B4264) TaxID=405532 RepID=B7HCV0_BACC4|nr:hypothetical protein BCB4264_A4443 [Bacillus cereus B4264]ASI85432.1 hypothetical protein FORC48_4352 [Bacillus cereus]EEK87532.1 hypothetical protein bcere0011_40630 [Bacillus cereus m1550]EEK92960.1 hypothetical protein bcere0012_40340 [Bacillus cereus BDRD-ST24]EEL09591.1 hypothetical protein bcere0015_40460 [Bacillus cereus BDRD-Cer4]EEL74644.1 hypothetical protein bcere0027_40040 [Bacillus cereus AH676]EEM46042.1 hypothetical protein bthur0005_40570 [Bacillus thuringiensis serovar pak